MEIGYRLTIYKSCSSDYEDFENLGCGHQIRKMGDDGREAEKILRIDGSTDTDTRNIWVGIHGRTN